MTTWTINGKTPDQSFVFRSGLRMQITPEGDCREATFQAKGAGLGIGPLDAVQITCNGTPVFYGEVRVGGNVYDVDGHQYTLRSLALRLREVVIPPGWSAPQQAAHLTVQSLIQAVVGQLDGTVTIGAIQDLGFDCRAIKDAHQQNPHALLEQIVADGAGMGVKVRFGVNANREFFCVRAREDVAALTNDMLTGATRFTAPVAEAPCTAVLWFVAKRPDGSWVTHMSTAPEAQVYGLRVKPLSLDASVNPWTVLAYTSGAKGIVGQTPVTLTPEELGYLVDAARPPKERALPVTTPDSAASGDSLFIEAVAPSPASRLVVWGSSNYGRDVAIYADGTQIAIFPSSGQGLNEFYQVTLYASGTTFRAEAGRAAATLPASPSGQFQMFEMRAERLDTDLLDRLARFHYNIPASAPADIELREFRPPSECAGYVTLNGWQSPVEAWEYRLSAERGMVVGVLAGQADDPNKLAQAELIKARDGRAVITALTSRS